MEWASSGPEGHLRTSPWTSRRALGVTNRTRGARGRSAAMGASRRRLPLSLILILLTGWWALEGVACSGSRCVSPSCAQPRAVGMLVCVLRCGCHTRASRVCFCGRAARVWKRLGRCLVLRAAWLPTAGRRIEWSRCPTDVPYCDGLSPLLAVLAALIAGALGQQEECDTLGKSEAVDEAEPHRHAGARTCPGRSVGRAAGVSGRAQGCAGVYPSGANPDQPADRAPAPTRAREDSIRLDFCKQKSGNKVRTG